MKILLIIENLKPGGKQRRFIELIHGLKKQEDINFELAVLSRDIYYQYIFELVDNIHFIERRWKKDPLLFFRLIKLYRELKPDIIHTWGSMSSVYVLPVVIFNKVKFINSLITHAIPPKYLTEDWFRSKLTFPFSDVILANSNAGIEVFKVNSSKARVIYNGFNFSRINNLTDKDEIRKKFNISKEKVVGMVGAFEDRKDYNTYVKAAIQILNQRNDVCFIAVGNGKNIHKYQAFITENNIHDFKFTGQQAQVESIVNIFDIGVLATFTEGISNAIIEYMALAKPVIATDAGGTKELVINNKTGIMVKRGSVNDMVSGINYLLDNPAMAIKMGTEGEKRIKKEFNLDKMVSNFIDLYKELHGK